MNELFVFTGKKGISTMSFVTLKPLFLGDTASTPQGVSKKFKPNVVSVIQENERKPAKPKEKAHFKNTHDNWNTDRKLCLSITCILHAQLDVSNTSKELDYLVEVCLIKVGDKLCRTLALQEQYWESLLQSKS